MIREVRVAQTVVDLAHDHYGEHRPDHGDGSEYDFVAGPLAAAVFAFRDFEQLRAGVVPEVRSYIVLDPVFGPTAFVGVLVQGGYVEIVDFQTDPDYWSAVEADPD